jgi:hypothetical protein
MGSPGATFRSISAQNCALSRNFRRRRTAPSKAIPIEAQSLNAPPPPPPEAPLLAAVAPLLLEELELLELLLLLDEPVPLDELDEELLELDDELLELDELELLLLAGASVTMASLLSTCPPAEFATSTR